MECLNKCEFMDFDSGYWQCNYYNKKLSSIHNKALNDRLIVKRCNECINEGYIGSNTVDEAVKKIKQRLGFIGDTFYSFKDDFETELTEIYRILKFLEKKPDSKDENLKMIEEE